MAPGQARTRAFNLLELVIVVVLVGILAALAIPRLSRGAQGAADAALTADLGRLRHAIELYRAEHGGAPPERNKFVAQLTTYTEFDGGTRATRNDDHIFGPYISRIPPLPVGADKGKTSVVGAYAPGNGWVYVQASGEIRANCADSETDASGRPYNTY